MDEIRINELVEKGFEQDKKYPEIVEAEINVDGYPVKVFDLMKNCFKRGLEVNVAEEIKASYSFSENPKFEKDGLFASYYVVAHLYSDHPELCQYDGNCLRTVEDGILIEKRDIVGAIKVNIPFSIFEKIRDWRDVNFSKVALRNAADRIVYHLYDKEDEEYATYLRLKRKYEEDPDA